MWSQALLESGTVNIVNVYCSPSNMQEAKSVRAAIMQIIDTIKQFQENAPIVVAGDFN